MKFIGGHDDMADFYEGSLEQIALNSQLRDAVQNGDPFEVRNLIDRGAQVVIPENGGVSVALPLLHLAAAAHRNTVVEILVGADPRCTEEVDYRQRTALHHAALAGLSDTAHILVQMNIDPDKKDAYGLTAADLALARGHEDVLEALEGAGITVNRDQDVDALRKTVAHTDPVQEQPRHTTRVTRRREQPDMPDIPIR